jgi:hypothetical protein
MKLAHSFEETFDAQRKLYERIWSGESFSMEDDIIPSRDDVATVYKFLRREYRIGHSVFTLRRILAQLKSYGETGIGYAKLKFIVRIMQELLICGVTETDPDSYVFEFYDTTSKTNLEKSSILHKLKKQLRKA